MVDQPERKSRSNVVPIRMQRPKQPARTKRYRLFDLGKEWTSQDDLRLKIRVITTFIKQLASIEEQMKVLPARYRVITGPVRFDHYARNENDEEVRDWVHHINYLEVQLLCGTEHVKAAAPGIKILRIRFEKLRDAFQGLWEQLDSRD